MPLNLSLTTLVVESNVKNIYSSTVLNYNFEVVIQRLFTPLNLSQINF